MFNKKFLFLSLLILMVCSVFASAEVVITKTVVNDIVVKELENPAVYTFKIKNQGTSDDFELYNFLNFKITPVGTFNVGSGMTENIRVEFYAPKDEKVVGFYNVEYYIKGKYSEPQKDFVLMKVLSLKDLFEVGSENIQSGSNSIKFYIANREAFAMEDVKVKFSSAFFEKEEQFSMGKNERKEFTVQLDPEDYKRLVAGTYTLKAEVEVSGKKTEQDAIIKFLENENVETKRENNGIFINNDIVTKTNKGNVVADVDVLVKKNILTRLFTSFTPEADEVVREGGSVFYSWSRELNPSEEFRVVVKTNYFFPLILVLFVLAVVVVVRVLTRKHLIIRKRVSYVRVKGKGGDFALKITIVMQAREFIEKVNVIDRLPGMVKLHEQFLNEKPSHVDEKTRKVVWKFENLDKGEIRTMTYIVYSKIGVLGKFVLPRAVAIYEKNGDIHESESNRAYFLAEQVSHDRD